MRQRVLALWFLIAPAALADELGQQVWMNRCKGCHGLDGRAQTQIGAKEKIPDFASAQWQKKFADPDIRQVVTEGSASNPKMKPFGDRLSPEEIDAVVRFVRGLR